MNIEQERQMRTLINTALTEQKQQGLKIGALAVSKIIMDKLNDTSKPLVERINDVKKYCMIATKNPSEFLGIDKNQDLDKEEGESSD